MKFPDIQQFLHPSPGRIDPVSWRNFIHRYSHKVIRLVVNTGIHHLSFDLLRQLLAMYGGSLFPRLASIRISMRHLWLDTKYPTLELLAGPSLLDVEIYEHCHADERDMNDVIKTLARSGPHIRRFCLSSFAVEDGWLYNLQCGALRELRVLELCDINMDTWYGLASCPFLEEVNITEARISDPEGADDTSDTFTLPSLKTLSIGCFYLSHTILVTTVMPSLRKLNATGWEPAIVPLLAQRSPNLVEVQLDFWSEEGQDGDTVTAASSWTYLRVLKLNGWGRALNVTDATVEDLAKSLRHLEVLSIEYEGDEEEEEESMIHTTGRSLSALAQHCRKLVQLELSIDLSHSSPTSPEPTQISSSLTQFVLFRTVLPVDVDRAARFLVESFPNVPQLQLRAAHPPYQQRADLVQAFERQKGRTRVS